jgi:hypothetical protein
MSFFFPTLDLLVNNSHRNGWSGSGLAASFLAR